MNVLDYLRHVRDTEDQECHLNLALGQLKERFESDVLTVSNIKSSLHPSK